MNFSPKSIIRHVLGQAGLELRRRSSQHVTPITAQWLGTFLYYLRMYDRIRGVTGDIVECGVGRGRTFLFLAFLVREENARRTLWGFDSFAGFPEPSPKDKSFRNPKAGEKTSSCEDVLWMLRDANLGEDFIAKQVKLVPGFFDATLAEYSGKAIALLHADVDLYQSYQKVLETLYPKVAEGGAVLFDEYRDPAFPGATKAIEEYFPASKGAIQRDTASGKHYLIKPQF